ncbi:MAG: DNA starvation/stationary phase protection protein Dps [Niveispirillum sp.]|uniref:DNA starvation/stationary phase protection protein Dps n=1 Tax=Niveispirillum sp. TaxID=1917217 RepID=UPI0006B993B5
MMQYTHNTLSENTRGQSVELLNRHLAAAVDLHAQVKQAHWNVRGSSFSAVHEMFDNAAIEVGTYADLMAERAAALGGTAYGSVHVAAERSFLVPYPLGVAEARQHIFALSQAFSAFGQSAREAIGLSTSHGDPVTADLFTQVTRGMDRQLWLIESHEARS